MELHAQASAPASPVSVKVMLFIDQVGDMNIVGLAQRAADGIELAFAAGFDVFLPAVDGEGDAALPCVAASAEVEVGEAMGDSRFT